MDWFAVLVLCLLFYRRGLIDGRAKPLERKRPRRFILTQIKSTAFKLAGYERAIENGEHLKG